MTPRGGFGRTTTLSRVRNEKGIYSRLTCEFGGTTTLSRVSNEKRIFSWQTDPGRGYCSDSIVKQDHAVGRVKKKHFSLKKVKNESPVRHDASTAEAAPVRVGSDEQGEARRADSTPNGGRNLELRRLRVTSKVRHDEQTTHRMVGVISSYVVYGSKHGLNLTSRLLRRQANISVRVFIYDKTISGMYQGIILHYCRTYCLRYLFTCLVGLPPPLLLLLLLCSLSVSIYKYEDMASF